MPLARLYIRSQRTTVISGHVSMETIGTAHTTSEYAEGSILSKLSREDEYARDLLRRSGIGFDVVDSLRDSDRSCAAGYKGSNRPLHLSTEKNLHECL